MDEQYHATKCVESYINLMDKEYDLKYVRSIIRKAFSHGRLLGPEAREDEQYHATKCIESVVNRLWERIDRNEHALKHVLTMQIEMQENIVKLNAWLTAKETAKCPIQD